MPLYIVVKPDDDKNSLTRDHVAGVVDDLAEASEVSGVWVVRSKHETCGQLAEELGIGADVKDVSGVVFKITASDGYYYRSFWDRVQAMEAAEKA